MIGRTFVAVLALAASARAEGPAPAADVQDLIVFHDAHPLFVRLHIEVDGEPCQTHWAATIAAFHKALDVDGDGFLSSKERGGWLQRFAGENRAQPGMPPPAIRPADGVATAADLTDYLRPVFGPFALQFAATAGSGPETLFERLDLDGDRALSVSELRSAGSTLMPFDQDEDETIRASELLPYQNPFMERRRPKSRGPQPAAEPSPFVALGPGEPRVPLARRLLARYDRKGGPDDEPGKDNRLQRDEIGLDPGSFDRADQDGDGGLDPDELARALADFPRSVELRVRLGHGESRGPSTVEAVDADGRPAPASDRVRAGPGGNGLILALDPDLIEVVALPNGGVNYREFYREQFRAADGDNNKYLDKDESRRNGIFNAKQFAMMDRDGDGKLFEAEMIEFVDRQVRLAESRTVLSATDQGRSLFQILDRNHDGRLSVRELRRAADQLPLWDRNHDGLVAADEIPRHYRLDFGPGQSPWLINLGVSGVVVFNVGSNVPSASASVPAPRWFTGMDLNRDGDVSPHEFLGARDQFRSLDSDGDGLIDPAEASKAR